MAVKKTAQSGQKSNISPGQRKSTEPARQLLLLAFKTTRSKDREISRQSKIKALSTAHDRAKNVGLLTGVNQSARFNNAAANRKSMNEARAENQSRGMIVSRKEASSRLLSSRNGNSRIRKDRK